MGYFAADLNYVLFMRRFPEPPTGARAGAVLLGRRGDQLAVVAGAVAGRHRCSADRIPTAWGLGFAGTLALLGLTYSLLPTAPRWIAAAVAGCAAVAAYALPLKLNILVAIAAAVAIGLLIDHTDAPALPSAARHADAVAQGVERTMSLRRRRSRSSAWR